MNFSFHSQFVDCPLNGFRRSLGRGAQFFPDQYLMHFSRTFIFLPFFSLPPTELTETQCIHRNAGTNRGDSVRLLADGVAGKLQRNCDANENFRFHQSKYNTSRKKSSRCRFEGCFGLNCWQNGEQQHQQRWRLAKDEAVKITSVKVYLARDCILGGGIAATC